VGFEWNWGEGELPVLPHWLFKWKGEEGRREDVVERLGGVMRGVVEEGGGVDFLI
jgi:hypothetical protein